VLQLSMTLLEFMQSTAMTPDIQAVQQPSPVHARPLFVPTWLAAAVAAVVALQPPFQPS